MRVVREIVLGVSLLALVGCGGGGGGGGGGSNTENPPPGTCSFTLSGALTGSYGCTYATVNGSYLVRSGKSAVIHMFQTGADGVGIGLALTVDGRLAPGTYTESSSGLVGTVSAGTPTGSWSATVGLGPTLPDAGAFRVAISEVRNTSSGADGDMFTIHGTLEATLPSRTGGASAVTVRGAF